MYKSQFGQDRWVEEITKKKRNGFFVELGARDGFKTSNSHYLEHQLDWSGILVECDPENITKIRKLDRKNSIVDTRAISKTSGEKLNFYIGISNGIGSLNYNEEVTTKKTVSVTSVSLSDLLNEHRAPYNIDYISMDVEGVELDVLEGFLWNYDVSCWTIETGDFEGVFDSDRRDIIREIMFGKGYQLVEDHEGIEIDDWFFK